MYGDKLEIAKKASKTVINTLNNNDFIGVISFGNSGVSLMYDNIVRATSTVKENLLL